MPLPPGLVLAISWIAVLVVASLLVAALRRRSAVLGLLAAVVFVATLFSPFLV